MATLFTRIISGELPGRFVWRDERAVAFLSINPMGPGHTLVVPTAEVDHWVDVDDELLGHLNKVSHRVAEAVRTVWQPPRVALIIAGFEVPHLHLHVYPAWRLEDFDFRGAQTDPDPAELDKNAEALRQALRDGGHGERVPA
ncbi:HIT family protein [Pseudonocardia spinosispora]|uniref:HIT family protein n=1 Tax=Pseudonocardia spinosispora TaxID=103441 RepID=UPI000422A5C6|nr:HIT family protein [Pseudonocardia spinosispora]